MGENWCMPLMVSEKRESSVIEPKLQVLMLTWCFSRIVKIGCKSAGSEFGQTDFCNGFC